MQVRSPQMKQTSKQLVKFVQRKVASQPWKRSELTVIIDTLKRAIGLMERYASMAELKNANSFTQALFVLAQACTLSSADANRLTVLIQDTKSVEADGEDSLGGPASSARIKIPNALKWGHLG